jgi:hypothetical protein
MTMLEIDPLRVIKAGHFGPGLYSATGCVERKPKKQMDTAMMNPAPVNSGRKKRLQRKKNSVKQIQSCDFADK